MAEHNAYLYVMDTLADWEPGLAIAELNSGFYFRQQGTSLPVKTIALTRDPVTTMGGVTIRPDHSLDEVRGEEAALLILPGSGRWDEPQHAPILALAEKFLAADIPVAAICGATVALARSGMLNHRRHTSIDLTYLKKTCSAYTGEALYQDEPAVTDGNLITASGIAPLEFAYHIIRRLDVFAEATLDAWYNLFSTHEARYYDALMQSLPK